MGRIRTRKAYEIFFSRCDCSSSEGPPPQTCRGDVVDEEEKGCNFAFVCHVLLLFAEETNMEVSRRDSRVGVRAPSSSDRKRP